MTHAALETCRGRHAWPADLKLRRYAEQQQVINLYAWADYFSPQALATFTHETGIRVRYYTFDTNDILEAKLLAGRSGCRDAHCLFCSARNRGWGPAEAQRGEILQPQISLVRNF